MIKSFLIKYRKTSVIILSLLSACVFLAFAGCSNKNNNNNDIPEKEPLYLSAAKIEIERYEDGVLSALDSSLEVEWTSSNEEVVKIDENGRYLAIKQGASIIKAKSGEKEGTCKITVIDNGYRPIIKTGLVQEQITLLCDDEYLFAPYVSYNGKDYQDAQFTFTDANGVVKFENGKIIALKEGESFLTVVANWRGFSDALVKEIAVKVTSSAFINVSKREINIETSTLKGGIISEEIQTTFFEDNQEKAADITWEFRSGEGLVTIEDNVFTACKEGVSKIVAKAVDKNGAVVYSPVITVNVELTTEKVAQELIVEYPINKANVVLPDSSQLRKIYQDQTEIAYDKETGEFGDLEMGEKQWIMHATDVDGHNVAYEYQVIVARIIRTADEFINIYNDIYIGNNPTAENGYQYGGYFLLANNIDCTGKEVSPNVVKVYSSQESDRYDMIDEGFLGTLNGNGYTVSNLTARVGSNSYGIFGTIGQTGVVKNVAFTNVKGGYNSVNNNYGALAANMSGTLENVYVHTEDNFRAAFKIVVKGSTIKNVVVSGNFYENSSGLSQQTEVNMGVTYGCYIENCYAFTNATHTVTGYEQFNLQTYKTDERFIAIDFNDALPNNYWSVANGEIPTFSSLKTNFNVEYYKTGSSLPLSVDLAFMPPNQTITSVKIGGATFSQSEISIDSNKLIISRDVLDGTSIPYGINNVEIICGQQKYFGKMLFITKVITSAEELLEIYSGYGNNPTEENGYQYGGYFVLGGNIDATGVTLSPSVKKLLSGDYDGTAAKEMETWGFVGTFDGRGYTISGLSAGENGIFGTVGNKGVIKNVAFTNLKGQQDFYALAGNFGGTLENVYISTEQSFNAIIKYVSRNTVMKNTIIKATKEVGLLQSPDRDSGHNFAGTYENAIFVSPIEQSEFSKWDSFALNYKEDQNFINYDWTNFDQSIWAIEEGELPIFITMPKPIDDTESNGVAWDEIWNETWN